jgi:uncharacterized protein YdaU (DUF1376 family)
MHYYNFNIGDYIKHTMHLSPEEDICYRRLLDLYYDTEQPIPTDIPWVSRRLRMGSEVVESVLNEFFELTEEGYRNRRADAEIEDYHAYIDKQRSNGKLGGRPKKSSGKPTANPSQTQAEPKKSLNNNQQTYPTNREKNTPSAITCPAGVLESTWTDFVKQRKAKRAAITDTALKGIEREASKAGISLDAALQEICARGWTGFKAEWIKTDSEKKMTHHQASTLAAARTIFGDERKLNERAPRIIDVTGASSTPRLVGPEDLHDDAGSLRNEVPKHVEDGADFI